MHILYAVPLSGRYSRRTKDYHRAWPRRVLSEQHARTLFLADSSAHKPLAAITTTSFFAFHRKLHWSRPPTRQIKQQAQCRAAGARGFLPPPTPFSLSLSLSVSSFFLYIALPRACFRTIICSAREERTTKVISMHFGLKNVIDKRERNIAEERYTWVGEICRYYSFQIFSTREKEKVRSKCTRRKYCNKNDNKISRHLNRNKWKFCWWKSANLSIISIGRWKILAEGDRFLYASSYVHGVPIALWFMSLPSPRLIAFPSYYSRQSRTQATPCTKKERRSPLNSYRSQIECAKWRKYISRARRNWRDPLTHCQFNRD